MTTPTSEPKAGFYNPGGHIAADYCAMPVRTALLSPEEMRRQDKLRQRALWRERRKILAWRLRRILALEFDDGTCGVVPAYTGGLGRPVAVDGKLRSPACFGSRGEPWAFPLGSGRACDPDFDQTILVQDLRRGRAVLVELYS